MMKNNKIFSFFFASLLFSGVAFSAPWFGKSDEEKHEDDCKALGYGMSDSSAEFTLKSTLEYLGRIEEQLAASQNFIKDARDSRNVEFEKTNKFFGTLNQVQRLACQMRSFFRPPRRSGANAGIYKRQGISELLKDDVLSDDELSDL
jgi:hypothetical protein